MSNKIKKIVLFLIKLFYEVSKVSHALLFYAMPLFIFAAVLALQEKTMSTSIMLLVFFASIGMLIKIMESAGFYLDNFLERFRK